VSRTRPNLVLLVVGLGTLLGAMAGSMVNLALPSIGRDLNVSIESSRWVVQAFLIVTAVVLLPAGRLGDLIGHRRVYLIGFALFGVTSIACGLAGSFPVLVGARILQGLGAAMLIAVAPALLTTTFPPEKRGRALGVMSTATYIGLTISPPLTGLIISVLDWRWTFYLMAPVAALICALGLACLPRGTRASSPAPLFDLTLFRSPVFRWSVLAAMFNYVALFTAVLLMPFYLEEGRELSPAAVGLVLAAQPMVMALTASPSGWLSDRIGTRALTVVGMILTAGGLGGMASLSPTSSPWVAAGWLALMGLGTGIFISPNSSALMGAAPRERQGIAGSVMAEARTMGMLLGVVLSTGVFQAAGGSTGEAWEAADFGALRLALLAGVAAAVISALAAALSYQPSRSNQSR